MKVLNLSFYIIPRHELPRYLRRHAGDSALYGELGRWHQVTHLHLVENGAALPARDERNRFFPAAGRIPWAALRFIKGMRPDVVIVHSFNHTLPTLALRLALKKGARILVWHHAEKPRADLIRRLLQRAAYGGADRYLFAGQGLANLFVDAGIIGDRQRVRLIMEVSTRLRPVARALARAQLGIGPGPVLLWVGRLNRNKDPMTVLRAIRLLKETCRAHLYMAYSEGEMEDQVAGFVTEHALEAHVSMVGTVPHDAMAAWYSAADYFIAASHYEGSGTALCEAMACGCIPVVTNIPSFRFMTRDGACAYLYPPGDHKQLAEVLQGLADGSAPPLSQAPQDVFRENLSYEAIGSQLATLVTEVSPGA